MKDSGGGARQDGVAWFEQFARLRNPDPWTIEAAGIESVPAAVIPDDVILGLPDDARISLTWTFVVTTAAENSRPMA